MNVSLSDFCFDTNVPVYTGYTGIRDMISYPNPEEERKGAINIRFCLVERTKIN